MRKDEIGKRLLSPWKAVSIFSVGCYGYYDPATNISKLIKHIFPNRAGYNNKDTLTSVEWGYPTVRSTVPFQIITIFSFTKHEVAQLVEALRYKPECGGFDSRWDLLEFFIPVCTMVLGVDSASVSTR